VHTVARMHEVLIIEDDTLLSRVVARIVRAAGYKPVLAISLMDGLEQIQRKQFHLILTDYLMANGSGLDVLALVAKVSPTVPVIVMSGADADDVEDIARANGAAGYLTKPFSVELLVDAITELERRARERRVPGSSLVN
jgi:two-component system, OmpR family, response regulator